MTGPDIETIRHNIEAILARIAAAAKTSGRNAGDITLVSVSKTFPDEIVAMAVKAGATDLGESKVQEGTGKIERLGRDIARWHLIGHLQSNKANRAVEHFDMIQSLDSLSLAEKISQHAVSIGRRIDCLVEVNSSGEEAKFGFDPGDVLAAAEQIAGLPGINLRGMMTIGPWTTNDGCVKKAFESTRTLFEKMQTELGRSITVLSMGMSSDFELAISCGSTMVRVGTAIFGTRETKTNT